MSTTSSAPDKPIRSHNSASAPSAALLIAAGLAASLIALLIWETGLSRLRFSASAEATGQAYTFAKAIEEVRIADQKNTVIAYGSLGAILALTFALIGLRSPSNRRNALMGPVLSPFIGFALPAFFSWLTIGYVSEMWWDRGNHDPVLETAIFAGIWALIGLGSAASFGLTAGLDPAPRAALMVVTALSAAAASPLYQTVITVVYSTADTIGAIAPTLTLRILTWSLVGGAVGLGIALGCKFQPVPPSSSIDYPKPTAP